MVSSPHGGVDSLSQGSVLVMTGRAGLTGNVELTASVLQISLQDNILDLTPRHDLPPTRKNGSRLTVLWCNSFLKKICQFYRNLNQQNYPIIDYIEQSGLRKDKLCFVLCLWSAIWYVWSGQLQPHRSYLSNLVLVESFSQQVELILQTWNVKWWDRARLAPYTVVIVTGVK